MMSQGGQLWQKLNVSDKLLQQTTISGVRMQDSNGKSRSGSSTLTPMKIATAKKNFEVVNLKE